MWEARGGDRDRPRAREVASEGERAVLEPPLSWAPLEASLGQLLVAGEASLCPPRGKEVGARRIR